MNRGFIYNPAGFVKNFKSLRAVCFWAGGLGVIQSLIWIALTVTGILAYNCVIRVEGTFNYGNLIPIVFLQLYFKGTCDKSVPAFDNSRLLEVQTILSSEDIIIWDIVYLAVAVCWLLTSVLLMACTKQNQPRVVIGILWTWIVLTFCICAMDLALGVIFGFDCGRFNRKAYNYNLSSMYAGAIDPDAAQLVAGMIVSMSMIIVSLKGFILWIINVGFLFYLTMRAIFFGQDNNGITNLFMPHKESDDILSTRPPINAYQEEEQKPSVLSTVFINESFQADNNVEESNAVINRDIIARAARLSADISQQEGRFRNLDNFQQYPIRSRPVSVMPEQQTSPVTVSPFPAPDYTPPMQRAAKNLNRNQRFH